MNYLSSAFSLQMLPDGGRLEVEVVGPLQEADSPSATKAIFRLVSVEVSSRGGTYRGGTCRVPDWHKAAVGHEGTATELTRLLGIPVAVNRESIRLSKGDTLWVAQPTGKRLEYGKELDAPALTLFEVRVLGAPPAPGARLDLAPTECLWDEIFRREDRDGPEIVEAARLRVLNSH